MRTFEYNEEQTEQEGLQLQHVLQKTHLLFIRQHSTK